MDAGERRKLDETHDAVLTMKANLINLAANIHQEREEQKESNRAMFNLARSNKERLDKAEGGIKVLTKAFVIALSVMTVILGAVALVQ